MKAPICFLDTETTGLDPHRHEIWEVGLIVDDQEHRWFLDVDLARADPIALSIGRFHDRHPRGYAFPFKPFKPQAPLLEAASRRNEECTPKHEFARDFAKLTHGRHLVGAVVSFDEERLRKLLLGEGYLPSWHYHLVDVEALAAGWVSARCDGQANDGLGRGTIGVQRGDDLIHIDGRPPWNSADLSKAVGVDCDQFDKHTALGDARWAKAVYETVMGR